MKCALLPILTGYEIILSSVNAKLVYTSFAEMTITFLLLHVLYHILYIPIWNNFYIIFTFSLVERKFWDQTFP